MGGKQSKANPEQKVLKADVRLISGCEDAQTSADVNNVKSFRLPHSAGSKGGACTSALLNVLYKDHETPKDVLSFVEVLQAMRKILIEKKYTQIPQLTSSKVMDINLPFHLVPESSANGTKRAVLIGIHYTEQKAAALTGCHNDVKNISEYIKNVWGFQDENITILLDDGEHTPPTRENILAAYKKLVEDSKPGDSLFCHFSGHGIQVPDDNGDEDDGFDEALVPVDYITSGIIRDDELLQKLVKPLDPNVTLTCLMDCCHSGTILDLPYKYKADSNSGTMALDCGFDFKKFFAKIDSIFEVDDD